MLKIRQAAAILSVAPILIRSKVMSPDKFQDWFFNADAR